MNAPRVQVVAVDLFESTYRMRLPFRFGAITVTGGQQAIVRLRLRLPDGREGNGYAVEALAAKWFDKDPRWSDADNVNQLRASLQQARVAYLAAGPMSPWRLFADQHAPLRAAGAAIGLEPLVSAYGPALLDRAVLDALCRIEGLSFREAMRLNRAGIEPHAVVPDLDDLDWGAFLAARQPLQRLAVRHTVGMLDPITAADQPPGTRVGDGLSEKLEEVAHTYGCRHWKIKLGGRLDADVERLTRIAGVLHALPYRWQVTLDGNEQFDGEADVDALWSRLRAEPALARLCAAVRFIEQPIRRGVALAAPLSCNPDRPLLLIDESDGELESFPRALALGWRGVSSKACKGFYKSIVNRARVERWNTAHPDDPCVMSAEDLTTQPGLSLQQDLALVAWLGIEDVERNAHHFIDGFDGRPAAEAEAFARAHPDLYVGGPRPRLRIVEGDLAIASLGAPGFGTAVSPRLDETPVMPPAAWPPVAAAEAAA